MTAAEILYVLEKDKGHHDLEQTEMEKLSFLAIDSVWFKKTALENTFNKDSLFKALQTLMSSRIMKKEYIVNCSKCHSTDICFTNKAIKESQLECSYCGTKGVCTQTEILNKYSN